MKVFVGVSYNRDHETQICGVSDCRQTARRMVELARNEMLFWSRQATDGPNGGSGLDDSRGDLVGHVLAFEVGGASMMNWRIIDGMLSAQSVIMGHSDADNTPLVYSVFGDGDQWKADFDGRDFASGTLEHCMAACRKSEDEALFYAVQNSQKEAEPNSEKHGRMLWMLKRFLNPEDLGHAVPAFVRDDVREVLGMARCEHAKTSGS